MNIVRCCYQANLKKKPTTNGKKYLLEIPLCEPEPKPKPELEPAS